MQNWGPCALCIKHAQSKKNKTGFTSTNTKSIVISCVRIKVGLVRLHQRPTDHHWLNYDRPNGAATEHRYFWSVCFILSCYISLVNVMNKPFDFNTPLNKIWTATSINFGAAKVVIVEVRPSYLHFGTLEVYCLFRKWHHYIVSLL